MSAASTLTPACNIRYQETSDNTDVWPWTPWPWPPSWRVSLLYRRRAHIVREPGGPTEHPPPPPPPQEPSTMSYPQRHFGLLTDLTRFICHSALLEVSNLCAKFAEDHHSDLVNFGSVSSHHWYQSLEKVELKEQIRGASCKKRSQLKAEVFFCQRKRQWRTNADFYAIHRCPVREPNKEQQAGFSYISNMLTPRRFAVSKDEQVHWTKRLYSIVRIYYNQVCNRVFICSREDYAVRVFLLPWINENGHEHVCLEKKSVVFSYACTLCCPCSKNAEDVEWIP